MLPARHAHLVLKHKSKHDFISKFEDLYGPKSYQHISALSRPLVRHPVPAVCGKEVSGETSFGCNGREISGDVQDVRAQLPSAPSVNHPADAAVSRAADI